VWAVNCAAGIVANDITNGDLLTFYNIPGPGIAIMGDTAALPITAANGCSFKRVTTYSCKIGVLAKGYDANTACMDAINIYGLVPSNFGIVPGADTQDAPTAVKGAWDQSFLGCFWNHVQTQSVFGEPFFADSADSYASCTGLYIEGGQGISKVKASGQVINGDWGTPIKFLGFATSMGPYNYRVNEATYHDPDMFPDTFPEMQSFLTTRDQSPYIMNELIINACQAAPTVTIDRGSWCDMYNEPTTVVHAGTDESVTAYSGGLQTWVMPSGNFSSNSVGRILTIGVALGGNHGNPLNNGSYVIAQYISPTSVKVYSSSGQSTDPGNGTIAWVERAGLRNGSNASIGGASGGLQTINIAGANFGPADVGTVFAMYSAATSSNNSNFFIAAVVSQTQILIRNGNGVTTDANNGSIIWAQYGGGTLDRIYRRISSAIPFAGATVEGVRSTGGLGLVLLRHKRLRLI
jgi:hypothetical protein